MALDFLLLQRYPAPSEARFRHYSWHRPSFTFGFAQKIAFVRDQLPKGEPVDVCRRPTGGGVVDHRDDWTFSLVIPRGHALEEARASHSYAVVHRCLAEALQEQGVPARLKTPEEASAEEPPVPGVCFQKAEIHDVVHAGSLEKIAGAAQKRNKHGLLFQGSIWRPACQGDNLDWDLFSERFSEALAQALGAERAPGPWPEFAEGEEEGLIEQYSSDEWNSYR
jgi:lipoate-protein ligase A